MILSLQMFKVIIKSNFIVALITIINICVDQKNNKEYIVAANNVDISKYISSDFDKVQNELKANGIIQEQNKIETEIEMKLPMAINIYTDLNLWKPFFIPKKCPVRPI